MLLYHANIIPLAQGLAGNRRVSVLSFLPCNYVYGKLLTSKVLQLVADDPGLWTDMDKFCERKILCLVVQNGGGNVP